MGAGVGAGAGAGVGAGAGAAGAARLLGAATLSSASLSASVRRRLGAIASSRLQPQPNLPKDLHAPASRHVWLSISERGVAWSAARLLIVRMPESRPAPTGGGLADLHPEPGPGRGLCAATDDDDGPFTPPPEDDSSVISLPPLATFTRSGASPVAWESEPRSSSGRRERSGLLSEAADDGLRVSSECGSPGGSRRGETPPPPPEPPVSRAQVAVIGLACFCTFGMGGVVFGISSLYPVLYAQGYWRAICDEAAASVCTGHSTKCCEAQLVRYSLVASRADTQRHGVPQPYRTHRVHVPASCVPEGQGSLPREEPLLCVRTSLGHAVRTARRVWCAPQYACMEVIARVPCAAPQVASVAFFSVDVASAPWGVLADRSGARACLAAAVGLSALTPALSLSLTLTLTLP